MDKVNIKYINKLISISLLIFSVSIVFVVSKYIGIVDLIYKIIKSLIPVFVSIFLSFLLEPFIGFFLKRGIKRKYSVLLVYISIIFLLSLILYFTIPSLIEQINIFIGNIPDLMNITIDFLNDLGFSLNITKLTGSINQMLINASKTIVNYVGSSFSSFFTILLGISGALFLSFDFPKFRIGVKRYIPKKIKEPVIYYFQKFLPFVHKYFIGILIDSLFMFTICIIGFSIIRIDYVLVISLFIAITNLIPIIGPYIGGIPSIIVGFSISSTMGVSSIIVVLIVQIIESHFIQPLILKNIIKLHPLEGILGISLFGSLFGVIGMILSPILIVAFKLLFIPYNEENSKKEEISLL